LPLLANKASARHGPSPEGHAIIAAMRSRSWCLLLLPALGCAPREPPNWADGGAPLAIAPARWERSNGDVVEITADGKVLEDGDLVYAVDRAGRVVDEDYEPVAILLPDGHVVGTDSVLLGRIGVSNGSPPHGGTAWFSILPDGNLVLFDSEGDRSYDGVWRNCDGAARRACALVTQIFALRRYEPYRRPGPSFGVGVGVGVIY
jgi:hypothetical protein